MLVIKTVKCGVILKVLSGSCDRTRHSSNLTIGSCNRTVFTVIFKVFRVCQNVLILANPKSPPKRDGRKSLGRGLRDKNKITKITTMSSFRTTVNFKRIGKAMSTRAAVRGTFGCASFFALFSCAGGKTYNSTITFSAEVPGLLRLHVSTRP